MKKLLPILLLLGATNAVADEYLIVNGLSKHIGATKKYNETNPGLGYAWDTTWKWTGDVQPQVGFYENSDSDWTVYFAVGKRFWSSEDKQWGFGGMLGAAYGYDKAPIMPMAALVGSWRHSSGYGLNLLLSAYSDSDHRVPGETVEERGDSRIKPLLGLQLVIPLK